MKKNREPIFLEGRKMTKLYRIMKLSVMFLLIGMLQVSAGVYSQGSKVSVNESDITLADLFWKIQSQTDFVFAFSNEDVESFSNLEVNAEGNIEEILNVILADKGLEYELKNGVYVIKRKIEEPAPVVIEEQQEEKKITITGTVKDENGEPLPFAAVCFKGTTYGCVSAVDGKYILEAPIEEGVTLEVSSLGYATQEIPIEGRTVIDIVMVSDMENLDEVVVTGYTKVSKVRATSATAKVTAESIDRQVTVNLDDRMEGLATGLNINAVTRDGGEESLELVLRGISTFDQEGELFDPKMQATNSANRQPLIVVDGFPYDGPFNDIDQATIESIDVLKDAAATALWGLRASNGVIVITTKRGGEGKPTVSFSTNWTFGTKQKLDDFGFASSADEIAMRNDYMMYNPTTNAAYQAINFKEEVPVWWDPAWGPYPWPLEENYGYKYTGLDSFDTIWADFYASGQTAQDEAQRDARLAQLAQNDVLDQFQDKLLRNGFSMNNSLSIRGGSKFINYNFTASHIKEEKTRVGDDFERLNLSLTTDVQVTDRLSALFDVSLATSDENRNGFGVNDLYTGYNWIKRYDTLVGEDGSPLPLKDVYAPYKDEFLGLGFDPIDYSPITDLNYRDNVTKTNNLRMAAGLNYKITNWLTADFKYQFNRIETNVRNHKPMGLYDMRISHNRFILTPDMGGGSGVERAVPYGAYLEKNRTVNDNSVIRGSLNFNKVFASDHVISGVFGMEATESEYSSNQQKFVGYSDKTGLYDVTFDHNQWSDDNGNITIDEYILDENTGQYDLVVKEPYLGYGSFSNMNFFTPGEVTRTIATFSNIGYSYKAKYNIEGSYKVAQGTAFGINERLAKNIYWALSGSWNAAKEDFLAVSWLDVLKLRASYGVNGNMRRGLTTETVIGYSSRGDWLSNRQYASIISAGNPNLAPEQTITTNLGVDFGFLNRIMGSIDVYDKQSSDLLVSQEVNSSFGLGKVMSNDGKISNKGIEVSLEGDIMDKSDFNWRAKVNFSYNKNEVLKYGDRAPTDGSGYYYDTSSGRSKVIGEDVSVRAYYDWAGLDENGDPQVYNKDREIISYKDAAFQELTQEDMSISKPFIAPVFGGLTNVFTYKNFTLSSLITYKFGHVFEENLDAKYAVYTSFSDTRAHHKDVANAWTPENTNTDIPAVPRDAGEASSYDRRSAYTLSNVGLQDASHIRLKDITLNYQLSSDLISKIGMKRASVMFQVRDLGILWSANDKDIDPDSVPFSGRAITFGGNFASAYRPGVKVPVSFVVGARFEF